LQRGDAIVSASVEIIPTQIVYVDFNSSFAYQTVGSVVDTSDPESITPPAGGYDLTGASPFGHDSGTGLTPPVPIVTAWAIDTSIWLKKDFTAAADGSLVLSGYIENGCLFFLDDELIGSVNADNSQSTEPTGIPFTLSSPITSGAHTLKILIVDEPTTETHDNTYFCCTVVGLAGDSGEAIRLWGGYGAADLPSDAGTSTFQGIGDRALVASSSGAIGGTAQNTTLALSGIEAAALEVLNPDEVRNASAVVRRLIFDSAGKTLLGAYVYSRGRLDELKTVEMVGGAAAIQVSVEGAARGLGRRGGRARSDADQRLVSASDGFYRVVSAAPKKTLYWGGKTPSIGGSLTGGGGGTTSASTSISSVRSF
jgi:hypothetical protein